MRIQILALGTTAHHYISQFCCIQIVAAPLSRANYDKLHMR